MKNRKVILSLLYFLNIILMFLPTFKIAFNDVRNRIDNMNFNLFNISNVLARIETLLSPFGIDNSLIALINILTIVLCIIIIGYIVSFILLLMKKKQRIIPIITSALLIVLNLIFIGASFFINNIIRDEQPFGFESFSATIFPYLIILISCLIIYQNPKEDKQL